MLANYTVPLAVLEHVVFLVCQKKGKYGTNMFSLWLHHTTGTISAPFYYLPCLDSPTSLTRLDEPKWQKKQTLLAHFHIALTVVTYLSVLHFVSQISPNYDS